MSTTLGPESHVLRDGARPSSVQQTLSHMLRKVLAGLEQAGIDWCLLNWYTTYPENVDPRGDLADVDIVVRPEHFSSVPQIIARIPDLQIVQCRGTGATSIRYEVVSYSPERIPVFLALDVYSEIRGLGTALMPAEAFLGGRRRFKQILWVPEPSVEFVYSILKAVVKSTRARGDPLDGEHTARLAVLYDEDPVGCRRRLAQFFGDAEARLVAEAAERGLWDPMRRVMHRLREGVARKLRRDHPQNTLRYWFGELRRRVRRLRHPTGLMVAFLGLHGAGKSTVIARVQEDLAVPFWSTRRYHVRPQRARRGSGVPGGDPHAKPTLDPVGSVAKLGLWWVDYWVGYLVDVVPALVRSTLVVFDRYYQDLLADPRHHRYGGPPRLARIVGWCIPRPHLIIFLDAPPDVARTRKANSEAETMSQQRQTYLQLVGGSPAGRIVDASRPLPEVVADVERIILDYMAHRTARRLTLRP